MNKNDKQPRFDSSTAYDDSEDDKVLRGSGWYDSARSSRVAYRSQGDTLTRFDYLGFRLVRGDT